jgi:hypothetical protein
VLFSWRQLYTIMLSFFEYTARSRRTRLPDTQTMLAMAGVSLHTPNEEETERLLNRERKRSPSVKKADRLTVNRLDGQPARSAGGRS